MNVGASEIICHFGSSDGDEVVANMETFARDVMPHVRIDTLGLSN